MYTMQKYVFVRCTHNYKHFSHSKKKKILNLSAYLHSFNKVPINFMVYLCHNEYV